jgi:hypothetical protein
MSEILRTEIEDGEEAPIVETLQALEEKYRAQMRQIVSQKIELPISTLKEMIEKQIDLSPDFQRRDRWNNEKGSRFIESIIMNVPIPPVFLGEDEYGKYLVLDGRQRLTAVYRFLNNEYVLEKLKVWPELNECNFATLTKRGLEKTLTRRFIPAVVILRESTPEVKYDVFDRLNTGGVVAEPMEIRNAIYGGKFNKLLHDVTNDPVFRKLWDIPLDDVQREENKTYATMKDLELALRFFALRKPELMDLVFRDHLSAYMAERNKEYKANPQAEIEDREQFHRAVKNVWTVFNDTAFLRTGKKQKSAPLADAFMIALSHVPEETVSSRKLEIKAALEALFTNDDFIKAIGSGTNGKGAISDRIRLALDAVQTAVG